MGKCLDNGKPSPVKVISNINEKYFETRSTPSSEFVSKVWR